MRFSAAAAFVLAAIAAAAPADKREDSGSKQIEKRLDPITLAIITGAASAAAGWATTEALNGIKGLIQDASTFDEVREKFTQDAVARMAANYGADPSFKGAICSNQGYLVNDPALRSDIVSLEVKSGSLKSDYDCFYLKSGGEFKGSGDGGFINIAADTNNGACGYLNVAKLMTCK